MSSLPSGGFCMGGFRQYMWYPLSQPSQNSNWSCNTKNCHDQGITSHQFYLKYWLVSNQGKPPSVWQINKLPGPERRFHLIEHNNNGICSGISTRWLFIHCFQIELKFRSVDFCGGRKTGEPREKPSEQGREPTTNSTHMWRLVQESYLGHSGGRWMLSPLYHSCSLEIIL